MVPHLYDKPKVFICKQSGENLYQEDGKIDYGFNFIDNCVKYLYGYYDRMINIHKTRYSS